MMFQDVIPSVVPRFTGARSRGIC